VELIDSLSAGSNEREVETGPSRERHLGAIAPLQRQLLVPFRIWRPISNTSFLSPQLNKPERPQSSIIKRRCPIKIANTKRNVAEHNANMPPSYCRRNLGKTRAELRLKHAATRMDIYAD
jgi:hypothetical protein